MATKEVRWGSGGREKGEEEEDTSGSSTSLNNAPMAGSSSP